jgi:hypothetical protein
MKALHTIERTNRKSLASMNNGGWIKTMTLLLPSILLMSCEAVAGVFKAGMNFGMFIVIAVIILVIFFIVRMGQKKTP